MSDLFTDPACDETPELPGECDETPRCAECGGPVERAATGRPRDYCSRSCQARAYRARKELGQTAPPERAGAGAYNMLRQVGSVLGSAAISAVVAARLAAHHLTAAQAGGSGAPVASVPQSVRGALGSALGESLFLPVALLAVGAVLCLRILRARRPVAQAAAEAERVEVDK